MQPTLQNRINPPVAQPGLELNPTAASKQMQAKDSTGPRDEVDFKTVLFNSMQDKKREAEARANGDLSAETNEEFLERLAEQTRQEDVRVPKNTLDKDDFLKLFVTQLKHQDPLNPDDGAEMAAKLAQFNSLEQLMNVNTTLQSMVEMQGNSRSMMLGNFLGKEITVDGGRLRLDKDGVSAGHFNMPAGAASAKLEVRDSSGTVVFEKDLGAVSQGRHKVQWDGTSREGASLPQGLYTFNIAAFDVDHREVPVDITSKVKITGIDLNDLQGAMYTDSGRVELSAIRAVGEAGFERAIEGDAAVSEPTVEQLEEGSVAAPPTTSDSAAPLRADASTAEPDPLEQNAPS